MNIGLIGGIVGSLVGLAGAVLGAYASISHTRGPRERRFMIRMTAAFAVAVTAFLIALALLPQPYSAMLWIPYIVALVVFVRWCNRHQQSLRALDATEPKDAAP